MNKCMSKQGHKEVTHACGKVIIWRVFDSKERNLLFKKSQWGREKWVHEEGGDQENKKDQTKKEMKKGWKKNSMKENHKKDQK